MEAAEKALIRLRPGRESESAALIAIERRAAQLLQGHPAYPLFSALSLDPATLVAAALAGRLQVAEADGALVGFGLYGPLDGQAHLLELDVDPAFGRRGIGRALLQALCEGARVEGFTAMVLTTLCDVPWNAPFYASAGFQPLSPDCWTPGLRAVMEQERANGFPMALRVAMRRALQ